MGEGERRAPGRAGVTGKGTQPSCQATLADRCWLGYDGPWTESWDCLLQKTYTDSGTAWRGQAGKISLKPRLEIMQPAGHRVSVVATRFCHRGVKAATV